MFWLFQTRLWKMEDIPDNMALIYLWYIIYCIHKCSSCSRAFQECEGIWCDLWKSLTLDQLHRSLGSWEVGFKVGFVSSCFSGTQGGSCVLANPNGPMAILLRNSSFLERPVLWRLERGGIVARTQYCNHNQKGCQLVSCRNAESGKLRLHSKDSLFWRFQCEQSSEISMSVCCTKATKTGAQGLVRWMSWGWFQGVSIYQVGIIWTWDAGFLISAQRKFVIFCLVGTIIRTYKYIMIWLWCYLHTVLYMMSFSIYIYNTYKYISYYIHI